MAQLILQNSLLKGVPDSLLNFPPRLSSLPSEFSSLKSLREIALPFNAFAEIPECLYKCPNLETVIMCGNKITSIDVQVRFFPLLYTVVMEKLLLNVHSIFHEVVGHWAVAAAALHASNFLF